MKKVLIIDDEPFIAKGLEQKINWNEYGCVVCGICNDGIQGKNKIIEMNPDIIISDILMPGYTGIELCKYLYEKNHKAKVILLTAYEDFSYIKKAMKYNVVDYLVKPLNIDELKTTILKIVNAINIKNKEQTINALANKSILFNIAVNNYEEKENVTPIVVNSGIILVVELEKNNEKENKILNYSIRNFIEKFLTDNKVKCELQITNSKITAIIYYEQLSISIIKNRIMNLSRMLRDNIIEQFKINIVIGIGTFFKDTDEIKNSYKNAILALDKKFFNSNENIFIFDNEKSKKDEMINFNVLMFYNKILEQKNTDVNNNIDYLFECSKGRTEKENVISYIIDVIKILNAYNNNGENMNEILFNQATEVDLYTLENFKSYFTKFIYEFGEKIQMKSQNESVVDKIINTINKRYSDKNLSLNSIANELGLTVAHVSRIFKKEANQNFIDYLTEVRIDKAKKLIEKTNKKTSEISEMVGFYESRYFSQVFKKKTGFTVSEYKNNKGDKFKC